MMRVYTEFKSNGMKLMRERKTIQKIRQSQIT